MSVKFKEPPPNEELSGYNVTKGVRLDDEMYKWLQLICVYEKKRVGTIIRDWVHEKIRVYGRNPDFKRWLKLMKKE